MNQLPLPFLLPSREAQRLRALVKRYGFTKAVRMEVKYLKAAGQIRHPIEARLAANLATLCTNEELTLYAMRKLHLAQSG
jgi:hypothetical protein